MTVYPSASRWPVQKFYECTGEFRPPRRGEFFLSGAIPEVYPALADLTTSYYIMREVAAPPQTITRNGFIYRRGDPA